MNLEKYELAINDYTENRELTLTQAAKKHHVHRYTLGNLLKQRGKFRRRNVEEIYLKAKEEYTNSENRCLQATAKKYNIHTYGFSQYLKKNNILIRKKYEFDRHYFDIINTQQKVYWLGFIAADGGIRNNQLFIQLSQKDYNHIHKFANIFGVPVKLGENYDKRTQKIYKYCRLVISSKDIVEGLKNKFLLQNKQENLNGDIFKVIPKKYLNHFIRGYFDGDGCISINSLKEFSMTFVGTKPFLQSLSDIMIDHLGLNRVKVREFRNHASVCWGGNLQLKAVHNWLYNDANIFMERKKEIWDKL